MSAADPGRRLGLIGLAALVVIAGLGLVMLAAPLLPLADPVDVDLAHSFAPPSADHPLCPTPTAGPLCPPRLGLRTAAASARDRYPPWPQGRVLLARRGAWRVAGHS